MFGMSGTELVVIFVLALLILGPSKLPELARSLGKAMRDFKRTSQDIRDSVETEFYRMDSPDKREEKREPLAVPPAGNQAMVATGQVSNGPIDAAPDVKPTAPTSEAESRKA